MDIREREIIHDVFLSFRGEDIRYNFTSHLYAALSRAGIQTFMDDRLERGEEISESLFKAIELSRWSLVIFSPNYANSVWCLNELVKIMDCNMTLSDYKVLPVFFHVAPYEVRHQVGAFGEVFEDLMRRISATRQTQQKYEMALRNITNISGWHIENQERESGFIDGIVQRISSILDNRGLYIADYPVGIGLRVQEVMSKLQSHTGSSGVLILGVWGMGGSGKSTIAKAIFNALCWKFDRRSFIANIREAWKYHNGHDLQEQLIFDILGETHMKIPSIDIGKNIIKRRLGHIRVLILLDDVNDEDQLKALCGNRDWFAASSIIIITTRNRALLNFLEVDCVLKMSEMENSESLQLFSWHAFRMPSPMKDFIELSNNIVEYCGRLPLALEVIGSFLFNKRSIPKWKDLLSKLRKIPNEKVNDKLKISFDGLNDQMERDVFLHICCFFIGKNKNCVTTILNGCGLHAEIGISVLIERSLVRVDWNNKLEMHDLLRDMGREIIRNESLEEYGKRSRLWSREHALDVLRSNMGTIYVKGLALRLSETNKICLPTRAFKQMRRLRLLQLSNVDLIGNYDEIWEELTWICWLEFPRRCPPRNFYKESLVAIDFKHSNLALFWKVPQPLDKLTSLNLSHSLYLMKTPDFSYTPNLERLILKDCPNLFEVHHTIGNLKNLRLVNFKGCKCLKNLPRSFYKLKSLEDFIIPDSKIENLEEDIEPMESLKTLVATNSAITIIPFSIVRMKSLEHISLCGYEGSPHNVFPSLIWSWMSPSNTPRFVQAFANNVNAPNYLLSETTESTSLMSNKDDLTLSISHNRNGVSRSENSLSSLLVEVGEQNILQDWTANQSGNSSFPLHKFPDWPSYSNEGQGVCFEVPHVGCNLQGMILCFDYSCPQDNMAFRFPFSILFQNNTKGTIELYKRDSTTTTNEESQWRGIGSNLAPGDKVEIIAVFGQRFIVKKTTIYLIYDQSNDKVREGSSTSNKDTETCGAYKEPTKANPKRANLDDDDEQGGQFKKARRQ